MPPEAMSRLIKYSLYCLLTISALASINGCASTHDGKVSSTSSPSPEQIDNEAAVAMVIRDELDSAGQLHKIPNRIVVADPIPAPLNAEKFRSSLRSMLQPKGYELLAAAEDEPLPRVVLRLDALRLNGRNPKLSLSVQWGPRAGYSVELQKTEAGVVRKVVSRL
ncbi:MAG: hypothetical protein DYH07_08325 [Armatimonadetes bacterium ATM1]|nr:hypothetical protein [Armatimonadota bacterium]MCE7900085.1 hypothetical protein [Armatimonadetes bacterium ATM1]RIJ95121.1 MAG: hypothetical protein DCC45_10970 [Armatimonadota bacterium]